MPAQVVTALSGPTPLAAVTTVRETAAAPALPRRSAAQRAEARRLAARSRSVRGALRRALLAGHLTRAEHDADRRLWRDAEKVRRLSGVLDGIADLAERRRLTRSRLPLAFLTLRTNLARAPGPAKARRSFGRDPRVWQAVPGQGWQVHHLATAAKLNGLARVCLTPEQSRRSTCRPGALRKTTEALLASATRRGSFLAWESLYRWGGARAGWISGMSQATAIQALTRASAALRRSGDLSSRPSRARDAARDALRAFERRPPVGVRVPSGGGSLYALYSDLPGLHVLNAHLQTLIGLREANARGLSVRAGRAFRAGVRAARPLLAQTDTGAWSLYARGGIEATLEYQRVTTGFLRSLCASTKRGLFCAPATRFARYLVEPPRVGLRTAHRARAGKRATATFVLDRVSRVRVRITSGKAVLLDAEQQLPRGTHALRYAAPKRRGTVRVVVRATSLSGRRAIRTTAVRVVRPSARSRARARR